MKKKKKTVGEFFTAAIRGVFWGAIVSCFIVRALRFPLGYDIGPRGYAIMLVILMALTALVLIYLDRINTMATIYEKGVAYQKNELKKLTNDYLDIKKLLFLSGQALRSELEKRLPYHPKIQFYSGDICLEPRLPEYPDEYLHSILANKAKMLKERKDNMKLPPKPEKYAKWEKRLGLVLT